MTNGVNRILKLGDTGNKMVRNFFTLEPNQIIPLATEKKIIPEEYISEENESYPMAYFHAKQNKEQGGLDTFQWRGKEYLLNNLKL